ncbi:hypothetical protein BDQ12DRAFT_681755 [Crucibulum laeve]|uniref:Uncharacterized protein n=1 Tax=Crucibulum laeve TaxID=68775 RepID=A0A5C3M241_9AGAR|nr:hypothetical protein BDQ12DRAFT_681755 [Crucibulum laeve]
MQLFEFIFYSTSVFQRLITQPTIAGYLMVSSQYTITLATSELKEMRSATYLTSTSIGQECREVK